MIVFASGPPPEKENEAPPPIPPKIEPPLGCAAGGWGAAGGWELPKLKIGVEDAAGAAGVELPNKLAGFGSEVPAVFPNSGFASPEVFPNNGFASPEVFPNSGFASPAVLPNSGFASWAGIGAAAPKILLVSVAGTAGVLAAPKKLLVSAGFAGSGAGVDAAEPNREEPDLVSVLPKANFFAAGSSVLAPNEGVPAPKRLPAGFAESVENREEAGFSA